MSTKNEVVAERTPPPRTSWPNEIEVSVVIPCLNEAETLGACIEKAQRTLRENAIAGEVIVADNGSSDGSQAIAERMAARLIVVRDRGYGSALMGGIRAARGAFIIMGDSDDSYDFAEIPRFVEKLRDGFDLVQGCRLPSGGGRVMRGAMPKLHRYWGNPMFSAMARRWFRAPIHDVNCGMRGFRKDFHAHLDQRCTGMEFAVEMIIKASLRSARIAEVPITLHPDGRKARAPHLRTFRDGWRTLRFYLIYSPRYLFLVPGASLVALGLLGYALAMPGLRIGHVTLDVHTLLFSSLALICGYQAIVFAVFAKIFGITERLLPEDPRIARLFRVVTLERGVVSAATVMVAGLVLLLMAVAEWAATGFGPLNYGSTMRLVIPGVTLTALGFQTVLSSFFLSMLGTNRR